MKSMADEELNTITNMPSEETVLTSGLLVFITFRSVNRKILKEHC